MIALDVKNVTKSYLQKIVLHNISFSLHENEIIAIVGPNGCGKSTLIRIISGLEKADTGEVKFGEEFKGEKSIGLVFQNHYDSLFPWKTVKDNIKLAIRYGSRYPIDVKNVLDRFGLNEHEDKYPYELSGGLSQLTNFARVYALNSKITLLDEPFSSLDYYSSLKLQQKFLDTWSLIKIPTVFVTHSTEEAIFLSDTIIVLSNPPTTVIKIIKNNVPRPRCINQITSDEFHNVRKEILENTKSFLQ